jgi:nicotinate-nucleotide adenylyltransferase
MNIAIFGGSFNPPTLAHIDIIRCLKENLKMDKIIIVPCGKRDDKPHLLNGESRISMLMIAITATFQETRKHFVLQQPESLESEGTIFIDDYEVKSNKKMIPTAYLLQMYHERLPGNHIYFVLGTDNLLTIHTWQEYEKYLIEQKFVVFNRFETPPSDKKVLKNVIYVDNFLTKEVSSTKIRQLIIFKHLREKNSDVISEEALGDLLTMINEQVLDYIIENQLYV